MTTTPRDAATLILLRDADRSETDIEVLMLRRHLNSTSFPGAYVFPGGTVKTADYAPHVAGICPGLTFQQAEEIIIGASPREKALGFFVAAIRETFEEAGILLAYRDSPHLIAFDKEQQMRFAKYRGQVQEDPSSFAAIIQKEGLKLATERLFYFAHWITPEVAPVRFDTRFFVAVAPPNQEALHDASETTAHRWITPREVLDEHRRDGLPVLFPTLSNIETLAQFSSVDEVIDSTRDREVPTIRPIVVIEDGKRKGQLPLPQTTPQPPSR